MLQGQRLGSANIDAMAQPLQGWTGVAKEVFLRNRLRLTKEAFLNELLRGQGVALGRSDARYSASAADTAAGETPTDPSMDRTQHRWYAARHMM